MDMEKFKNASQQQLNEALYMACREGNFEDVQHLLANPHLRRHADVNYYNDILPMACHAGSLVIAQYLLTSPELKVHPDIGIKDNQSLLEASRGGYIELVDYLLHSPELSKHARVTQAALKIAAHNCHENVVKMLLKAYEAPKPQARPSTLSNIWNFIKLGKTASKGANREADEPLLDSILTSINGYTPIQHEADLALTRYLLTSPEIIELGYPHANIHAGDDMALINACSHGNLAKVRYLLTSPEILQAGHTHASINAKGGKALICAIAKGHFEVATYLTSSPELTEHIDMKPLWQDLMLQALQEHHVAALKYCIINHEVQMTPYLQKQIENNPLDALDIMQLIESKTLNNHLQDHLQASETKARKKKI